jgi:hypothetical protein
MTPIPLPMPAKMRPTSSRGIMPMPTAQRFMEGGQPKPEKVAENGDDGERRARD